MRNSPHCAIDGAGTPSLQLFLIFLKPVWMSTQCITQEVELAAGAATADADQQVQRQGNARATPGDGPSPAT
jgi:hypothetical protein